MPDTTPACQLRQSTPQTLQSGQMTALVLDLEILDTAGMHTGELAYVTVPEDGLWRVTGWVEFASNPTGARVLEVAVNGFRAFDVNNDAVGYDSTTRLNVAKEVVATTGQTITLRAFQNSGSPLQVAGGDLTVVKSAPVDAVGAGG